MVRVVAGRYIREDQLAQAEVLFRELVEKTKLETGCIEYSLQVDVEDPTHFVFVETWESDEALKAHFQTEHFTRLIPQLDEITGKSDALLRLTPAL